MQTLATQMANGGGSIYQIQAQSSSVHALTYKPLNITAYSFFGAVSNLSFGIIKANTAENLLIDKHDVEANRHYFAICNPNLKPVTNATYKWISSASQTTLTLVGEWIPVNPVSGVSFSNPTLGQTQVTVSFNQGEPVYFDIKLKTDTTALKSIKEDNWVSFSKSKNDLQVVFSKPETGMVVKVHNSNGGLIYNRQIKGTSQALNIDTTAFQKGLLICSLSNGKEIKSFKWIN